MCNFQNNYTKAGVNDTIQLTFAVNNITTGIDESNGVNIHPLVAPNPASDIISVLNMDNKHIKQVEVYTTDWKQVKIQALAPGEEVKVNVEDLSAGSYIMLLKDAKGNAYPAKFIKR
ncbi:MAG: T9SS type A sorting domain-containing protein [bacterium]